MLYRALRDFEFHDQRGRPIPVHEGELVDVLNRHEASRLLGERKIGPKDRSAKARDDIEPAPRMTKTLRVGCWLRSSTHYSGGRLHVYQYVNNLARAGAEVFFISNTLPIWREDYEPAENITWLVNNEYPPPDLDIAFSDSKGSIGLAAKGYCDDHPHCRLVCLNFETANWVRKYVPGIARNMNRTHLREGYGAADMLLGNSRLSKKHLMEWMGETEADRRYGMLPPAINTHSIGRKTDVQVPDRPYAVWAARNTGYKCIDTAVEAVWGMDKPFDLVTFGEPDRSPAENDLHRMWSYRNFNDAAKYHLFEQAHMVLAPSLFEGFGMVPGEALAVGTMPIVYDLPVLREVYGDRLIYVPWDDSEAYQEKVREVASGDKPGVGKARLWVQEQYGMDAMAKRIEALPYHAVRTPSVDACMICYGTPTAPWAVRSVYEDVDRIHIAYGPTDLWKAEPERGVLAALRDMQDPDDKITIEVRDVWQDKKEMRHYLSRQVTGNRLLVLDADELWVNAREWIENEDCLFATPRWINLWHDLDHWIHDGEKSHRWGASLGHGSVCRHYRYSWWRQSYQWARHYGPSTAEGKELWDARGNERAAREHPDVCIWHLGHALPRSCADRKFAFYRERDNAPDGRRTAWQDWHGECGPCGDGIVERVTWPVPELVCEAWGAMHNE